MLSGDKAAHFLCTLLCTPSYSFSLEIDHEATRTPEVAVVTSPVDFWPSCFPSDFCISASLVQHISGSDFSLQEPESLSLYVLSDQLKSYTCPLRGRGL